MSKNWDLVPLGNILTERQEKPDMDDLLTGKIPIVEKIAFNEGKIYLRNDGKTKTGMILIRSGDLVLSGINATKGAIAIYPETEKIPIAATIHYSSYIVDKNKVDISFLWWLLRSKKFKEILNEYLPGGIKTELKAKRFLPIPIPLPPLEEQKRIVGKIERLAEKIEEVRSLRLQTIKETEILLKSLITKIFTELDAKQGCLSDILIDKPRNGWSVRCDNSHNGIPVLSLSAVTGFVYKKTEFKRTSETINFDAHYMLKKGDLLITRSNSPDLVGHVAIYDGEPSPCIYPDLMMRLEIDKLKVETKLVYYYLMSFPSRHYIKSNAKGTSPSMKKISQGVVMNIPFPIDISLDTQKRIVEYFDRLQSKIEIMKKEREKALEQTEALLPSILDKAFKGEL
ncbi:restriction endonuclease subunit S [Cyanobacterium aponinum]|uniref:restriction endonuclease subunit S n=1 Tax=Cyanobacterium aponinum TaxID=379064 RepID=UPI000C12DBD6|nr:restriction endonuclease subunit S [Cyanobacterium aponinum]PHV61489.1 hypothetical protein CSQ80_15280 [Cyanobacterium aponinum IPPAS B-1201]